MNTTKSWMPHAIAVALFAVLSIAFFPQVYDGYVIRQGDTISWVGMARAIEDHRAAYGEEPLWTWSMFGGMPAFMISYATSGNLLGHVMLLKELMPAPIYYFFAMMVSMYVLLLSLKVRPGLGVLGAIAFAFSSFFIISTEAGHNTKVHAIAYMPLILSGVVYLWRDKKLLGALLFTIALSLQIKANHLQITYYSGFLAGFAVLFGSYSLFKAGKTNDILKNIGFLVLGAVLALATNATRLWSAYEYSESTIRGKTELTIEANGSANQVSKKGGLDKDYITNWSLGLGETWSLVFPNAKGGPTGRIGADPDAMKAVSGQYKQMVAQSNTYWGNQPFTAGPVYVGAIIALLFLLGAVTVEHWIKWPLLVLTGLAIALAWGKNMMWLTDLFVDYFPLYGKFRTVTMWLVVVECTMPVLAVLFLHELFTKSDFIAKKKKQIFITAGVFGALLVLFVVTPGSFFDFHGDAEMAQITAQMNKNPGQASQFNVYLDEVQSARESMFKGDLLRSLGLMLLAMGGLVAFMFGKLKADVLTYGLVALVALDLWTVDKRYLNGEKVRGDYAQWMKREARDTPYPTESYDLQILQSEFGADPAIRAAADANINKAKQANRRLSQQEQYSVAFSTLDTMTNYRVLDLANNTFNTARTAFYHKGVGGYHAAKLMRYQELIEFYISRSTGNISQPVLNMLNTKYIITTGEGGVQQNPGALGSAWFVNEINWVSNADAEIKALENFNPKTTAVVDQRFKSSVNETFGGGTVVQTKIKMNHMRYAVNAQSDAFLVFSEIYYQPGWNAYIDGKPVDHARVNYVLRGLNVPAGEHTVEFKFEPRSYVIGERISFASSALVLLGALLILARGFRKP
jgi:hypothetical protein